VFLKVKRNYRMCSKLLISVSTSDLVKLKGLIFIYTASGPKSVDVTPQLRRV